MSEEKRFPSAAALVLARAANRVALKHADFGLARAAKQLRLQAMAAIKRRESVLSVPPSKK